MNNYKGENMINLRKLGLTALAGSLAAVSAQAGEMSVSGSHITTYTTGDAGVVANTHSANSLGSNTNITFSGSGDLDNGWSVSTFVAMNDATTGLSSSAATMTMGSMGTIGISRVGGFNVNGAYDETYPRAYEENSDAGGQSPSNYVGSIADDNAIIYTSPSFDFAGAAVNFGVEYALDADTATGKDGAVAADGPTYDEAIGVGVTASMAGLTLGAYASEATRNTPGGDATINGEFGDNFSGSYCVNYSMGPVSVGYQGYFLNNGASPKAGAATGIADYSGDAMGIAFNVNDQVSIGYQKVSETQEALTSTKASDRDIKSISAAYSSGGMTMSIQQTDTDNFALAAAASALDTETVQVTLSFAF